MDKTFFDDVAVIIPAFNEGQKIFNILKSLQPHFKYLIVVDDGSSDNTYETSNLAGAITLKHPINLGQGAALQTGITRALKIEEVSYLLTFDADGQHALESALEMVAEMKNAKVDIVLGSRFLNSSNSDIPSKKKLILKLGIAFTRLDSGLKVTDTHNGLRVMSRKFASTLKIQHAGMAHASEIINHIKITDSSWKEFPAQIYYTDYSIKKGQSILNAINILTEMIYK